MSKDINKKKLQKQRAKDVLSAGISNVPAGIGTAWDLAEAYYGAGLKLRQKRALEWVEMVRDNPGKFVEELTNTEEFQDKFVYCLEKYLRERSEEKRNIFKKIFLGEIKSSTDKLFSIEKYVNTLEAMSEREINALRNILKKEFNLNNFKNKSLEKTWIEITDENQEIAYTLVNIGILKPSYSTIEKLEVDDVRFSVALTEFGLEFIKYITNEN